MFPCFQVVFHVFNSPSIWLYLLLVVVASLLPDVTIRVFRKHWLVIKTRTRKRFHNRVGRVTYELNPVVDGQSSRNNNHHDNNNDNSELHAAARVTYSHA